MTPPPSGVRERRRVRVTGVVQGVGFRPFVHELASRHQLAGHVRNEGDSVVAEVEGEVTALDCFASALAASAPPLARVCGVDIEPLPAIGDAGFSILASAGEAPPGTTPVPPDAATCDDCLRELFDPADRRYHHPFITCTHCGPRFTIVRSVPYDRVRTTMAEFAMCDQCRREYEEPGNRRFHAETICCPECGPRLSMPISKAAEIICDGGIVAVKGLGGYHLACDATNEEAVARLRARKSREAKPFAVMAAVPSRLVDLTAPEQALLGSPARPIVLAARRDDAVVAESVAPGTHWLGVMLPYTPVHHLLLGQVSRALVMTSGNRGDEPIAVDDAEARRRLHGIADAYLAHDRRIHRRCEDSVVRASFPVRRSRGHAPDWLELPRAARRPIVAAGAELKGTFCVASGHRAWLSSHLGDLDAAPALAAFEMDLALHLQMLALEPEVIACDMHPQYASTRWALEQDGEVISVQHHHAHAAACLAEHGVEGPALALVFDGTGYGPDGTLWGGELLRCDLAGFERVAHLAAVAMPGGEAAVREPWRMAGAYLEQAGRDVPFARWPQVRQSLRVNAPLSSGMGRLFDAAAAVLGVRERVAYEGQAAIELEQLAGAVVAPPYACRVSDGVIVGADLIAAVSDDLAAGRPRAEIAAAFHAGVSAAAVAVCEQAAEPRIVALSGGSFQNLRLLASVRAGLVARGFRVLQHRRVPPGDGGISYGQAAVAAARGR
ncbi:MAG: carbamoyltransferase HypF [Solirubrobacteraceae bacterium]|jgi:hydrogenase maturation protein HypF